MSVTYKAQDNAQNHLIWRILFMADSLVVAAFVVRIILKDTFAVIKFLFKVLVAIFRLVKKAVNRAD